MKLSSIICLVSATFAVASPLVARGTDVSPVPKRDETLPILVTKDFLDSTADLVRRDTDKLEYAQHFSANHFSGDSLIKLNSNGWVNFRTYFKNNGALTQNFAIGCAIVDSEGRAYTFQRSGKVYGKARVRMSHSSTVDKWVENAAVRDNWADILAGQQRLECTVSIESNFSLNQIKGLINKAIDAVKKWYAGMVILAQITVFA